MNDAWKLSYLDEAERDLNDLDGSVRAHVIKAVRKVLQNPLPKDQGGYGDPLSNHDDAKIAGLCKVAQGWHPHRIQGRRARRRDNRHRSQSRRRGLSRGAKAPHRPRSVNPHTLEIPMTPDTSKRWPGQSSTYSVGHCRQYVLRQMPVRLSKNLPTMHIVHPPTECTLPARASRMRC